MAAKKKGKPQTAPTTGPPAIHEATLASGASGAVIRGAQIDQAQAVTRRQAGEDIVVCGGTLKENRRLALTIEGAVGVCERQAPHDTLAGPQALPHFQQTDRTRKGHTFYETENRKAKGKA